ncbi:MAG: TspO/MBR family protein [Rhodospirillaceae bacterium]
MSPRPPSLAGSAAALFGFLAVCFAVSALGSLATFRSVGSWYADLNKPSFNPPNGVFAPVWTTLYVMIALSGWRIWRRIGFSDRRAYALYALQLALNLAWSGIFFGLQRVGAALVELAFLWIAIAATLIAFWRHDRIAGLLLAPYLAWVTFAGVLNASIWVLN